MRRIFAVIMAIIASVCLCGCEANNEPEHQAYAISMSLDTTQDGLLTVGVQMPTLGGGGSGDEGSGKSNYNTYTATSRTFPEALDLLIATIPAKLVLSHLKSVIISEKLARGQEFGSIISDIILTYQLYGSSSVIVCKGEALKFIEAQKPAIGTRLSTAFVATIEHFEQIGYVPVTSLYEVYSAMHSIYSDPVLAYAATAEESKKDDSSSGSGGSGGGSGGSGGGSGGSGGGSGGSGGSSGGSGDSDSKMYGLGEKSPNTKKLSGEGVVGELARTGPDANEIMGSAVTRDGSMVGTLTGAESALLSFINGYTSDMSYYIDNIATRITPGKMNDFSVSCKKNDPEITLSIDVRVAAIPTIPDMKAIEDQLSGDIVRLIEKTQRMGVELFDISEKAARQFATIDDFLEYGFRDKFCKTPIAIYVTASEENMG